MCEALKSRDYDIRNNARKALTEIVHITGPYFFHYVVNEMKSVLNLGSFYLELLSNMIRLSTTRKELYTLLSFAKLNSSKE